MVAAAALAATLAPIGIAGVDWSTDGSRIAAIGDNGLLWVWDGEGRQIQSIDTSHDGTAIALSEDGKILAAGIEDTTLAWWTWDGRTYSNLQVRKLTGPVAGIDLSRDGRTIAASCMGSGHIFVIPTDAGPTRNVLQEIGNGVESVAFSPDGRRLAAGGQTTQMWDPNALTPMSKLPADQLRQRGVDGVGDARIWKNSGWTRAVAYSPRGETIAAASVEVKEDLGHTRTITTRSAKTGALLKTLRFRNIEFLNLDWSADNSAILAGGAGGKVVVADAAYLTVRKFWIVTTGKVTGVAYGPTLDRVATCDSKGYVRIWDRNGLMIKTLIEGEP